MSENIYPRTVKGKWVSSILDHLALYAQQATIAGESHVAIPKELLIQASNFRECSVRKIFTSDEDGPIAPFEAECRRQDGHDAVGYPDHVRQHSNGYFTWVANETLL